MEEPESNDKSHGSSNKEEEFDSFSPNPYLNAPAEVDYCDPTTAATHWDGIK